MNPYLFARKYLGLTQLQVVSFAQPDVDVGGNPEQFYRRLEHGMVHISENSVPLHQYGRILDRSKFAILSGDLNGWEIRGPKNNDERYLYLKAEQELFEAWRLNFLNMDVGDTGDYLSLIVDRGLFMTWAERLADWVAVERFKHGDKALSHGISPAEFTVMLQSPPVAMRIFKRDLGLKSEYSIAKYMHVPVADIQNWRLNSVVSGNMDAAVADMFVRAEDRLRLMGGV